MHTNNGALAIFDKHQRKKNNVAKLPALVGITALAASTIIPLASATATTSSAANSSPATTSATADISITTLDLPTGKSEGSGKWGVIGDIETAQNAQDLTYTYGVAINPKNGAITFTDSGKINWNTSTNAGTPSIHTYGARNIADGSHDTAYTDYVGNGQFSSSTMAASGSTGTNAGLGKMYADISDRATITLPADTRNGPRGVVYTKDGTAWIANSDNSANAAGPVLHMTSPTTLGTRVGHTPSNSEWPQRNTPGNLYYPVGMDVDASGTRVVVNSSVSESLHWYDTTTNTWEIVNLNEKPLGADQPYAVAVDKNNGNLYVPIIKSGSFTTSLQKRSSDGSLISSLTDGLSASSTVMFADVEPITGEVYGANQSGALQQWDAAGKHLQGFSSVQYPGLSYVRAVEFDANGRIYASAAQGTRNTRIMMLGKTPNKLESATLSRSLDGTSYTLRLIPGEGINTESAPYQQSQILDFVVEAKAEGSEDWFVVDSPQSVETTQTLTTLDANTEYDFRVFAINEAGTGDWITATVDPVTVQSTLADDSFSTDFNTAISLDVSANDTLEPGEAFGGWAFLTDETDPTTATDSITIANVGTWSITPQGTVTFTPAPSFTGQVEPVTVAAFSGSHYLTSVVSGTVGPNTVEPTDPPVTVAPTDPPVTVEPTSTPTSLPTETPSVLPTETPSVLPTETPSVLPTNEPSSGVLGDGKASTGGKTRKVYVIGNNTDSSRLADSGFGLGGIALVAVGLFGVGLYVSAATRRKPGSRRPK